MFMNEEFYKKLKELALIFDLILIKQTQKVDFALTMGVNDDLLPTSTSYQVAETRSKIDSPINDPDAILQIMFSGRHISVNWTIIKH